MDELEWDREGKRVGYRETGRIHGLVIMGQRGQMGCLCIWDRKLERQSG